MPSDGDGNSPAKKAPTTPVSTGTSNRPGGPTYAPQPGLNSGGNAKEYDEWWYGSGALWSQWMMANPEQADWVKSTAWTYRYNPDEAIDRFMQAGLNPPGDGGGGGRRVGGGGGGVDKTQAYANAEAEVRNRAGQLGITFDGDAVKSIAKAAVDGGWNAAQLDDYLVPAAQNTNQAGEITVSTQQIQQLAAQQLLKVSDATRGNGRRASRRAR